MNNQLSRRRRRIVGSFDQNLYLPAMASSTGVLAVSKGVLNPRQGMVTSPTPSIRTKATLFFILQF
jgi:hypothetical protein